MEYKIFKFLRTYVKIPYIIRIILAFILIFLSLFPIILPLFPGSLFLWIFMLVLWVAFIISANKLKYLVKIRKWTVYLAKNFTKSWIISKKFNNMKKHIKKIINYKSKKKRKNKKLLTNK